jgi:chromosome segregation ATPase
MALIRKQDIENLESNIKQVTNDLSDATAKFEKSEKELRDSIENLSQTEKDLIEIRDEEARVSADYRKSRLIEKQREGELKEAEDNLAAAEEARTDAENAREALEEEANKLDDEISNGDDEVKARTEKLADINEHKANLESDLAGTEPGTEKYESIEAELADTISNISMEEVAIAKATEKLAADRIKADKNKEQREAASAAVEQADMNQQLKMEQLDKAVDVLNDSKDMAENLEREADDQARVLESVNKAIKEQEKQLDEVQGSYNEAKEGKIRIEEELDYLESGTLLREFNEQKAEREQAFQSSIPNVARIQPVLYDNVDPEEAKEAAQDNAVLVNSIMEDVFGFTDSNSKVMNAEISKLQEMHNDFTAAKALEATRESFFDIDNILADVFEAAELGRTSIVLSGEKTNGMQVLALLELGYTVTHTKGKNLEFLVDWSVGNGGQN